MRSGSTEVAARQPRKIGPYHVQARLGAGGMGEVFLARSPGGRSVAVKVVHAAMADEPDFRARFGREVTAARAVNGVYTAAVLDADPDAPQPWLATAYLPGLPLQDAVAKHGPLPPLAVRALGAGLAEALISIHRAGIVHRDLKPSNVMLTPEGPRVIDFGIARASDASALTRTGMALGTPAYMSPEQASAGTIGTAADVFSLGGVLAYAATGTGPFGHGAVHEVVYRVLHADPDLSRIADPGLRVLIGTCLDKDPSRRPTPEQVLQAVAASPHGTQWLPPTVAHDIPTGAVPSDRRSVLLLGALSLGGVALVGGAITTGFLLRRGDSPTRWRFDVPGDVIVDIGPVVAGGNVYVCTRNETLCLNGATGALRWRGGFSGARNTTMAVMGGTGFVYESRGAQNSIIAFDLASGRKLWEAAAPNDRTLSPAMLTPAGVLCMAGYSEDEGDGLFAFDPATGRLRWKYRTEETVAGNAVTAGGVCALFSQAGSAEGFLHGVDAATGALRWRQREADILSTRSPVAGGGLLLAFTQGGIRAFDLATGRRRWEAAQASAAAMVAGDAVYVGTADAGLSVLDARTGKTRWSVQGGRRSGEGPSSGGYMLPALGGGLAVLSDDSGQVRALDAATGRSRWQQTANEGYGDAPMIAGGLVYQGTLDGLFGFDLRTGRPRYRLDATELPRAIIGAVKGLSAAGGSVYCAIDGRYVFSVRPPG